MWPFNSKPAPKDWEDTLDDIEKRMRRIEEEWTDVYHKFRQLHMRVAKQVQRLDQAPETETAQREESVGEAPSTLSARQRELNAKILMRRQRGGNGGLLHG